jgi:chloride channel protein, CIC family
LTGSESKSLGGWISSLRGKRGEPEERLTFIMMLAALVGAVGGVGAIVFRLMISAIQTAFFSDLLPRVTFYVWNLNLGIMLLPAIGGLLIGVVVYDIAPETRGTGIPQVMEAYTLEGGRIRARIAALKVLVSSVTLGSGGSAGREGPITQIGAATGSAMGRLLRLNEDEVKLLVVSGVAAGIAGTFNAPLGGALFGIEILQRRFSWRGTAPIILASVVGTAVASVAFGLGPAIAAPTFNLVSPAELGMYFLLGVIFGVLSYAWVRTFYLIEDFFTRLRLTGILKVALGGLLVGAIGMFFPSYGILGVGYGGIELVLAGGITLTLALVLAVAKILATSMTIGSGGSGGIFAPTLYVGAMFGGVLGLIFARILPGVITQPFGFSLSGMGALFAGAARAPLTSMIIIPEMTGDWGLLPALMISCVTSYYVSSYLLKHSSIYTLKLERRGIDIKTLSVPDYLDSVFVGEVMQTPVTVADEMPVSGLLEFAIEVGHTSFPVVRDSKLVGVVNLADAQKVGADGRSTTLVKEIMNRKPVVASARDTVRDALKRMHESGATEIMVVDGDEPQGLLGIVTAGDMVRAHELGLERSVE